MKKILYLCCGVLMIVLMGCSKPSSSAVQTRNDLTREHLAGLTSGMKRTDVIDLIGENDEALASKEDFDVYTLADGSTAVLRYKDDILQSAFIRNADNFEDKLFNVFERPAEESGAQTNTGNTNVDNNDNNTNNGSTNQTETSSNQNDTTNMIYESTGETTNNNIR